MSKLILGLLSDDNQLQKFEEIDMSWVEKKKKIVKFTPIKVLSLRSFQLKNIMRSSRNTQIC